MTRRRLTRRQRDYWFLTRYDALLLEGFAPEEAAVISLTRISTPPVKRLRRQRKRVLAFYLNRGLEPREAIEATRAQFRNTPQEILTWEDFRRLLYPKSSIFARG